MIRTATNSDLDFLEEHDHISRELMQRKITDSLVYVALADSDEIIGWLRYGLFWDAIPFMNMLYVLEPHRRKGFGSELVNRWEQDMHSGGFKQVMTSTQSDEAAQHFYRQLGYVDTGILLLPGEPAELILRKDIVVWNDGT